MPKTNGAKNWRQILRKFSSKKRVDTFLIGDRIVFRGTISKTKNNFETILKQNPPKLLNEFRKINLSDPFTSEFLKGFEKTNVQHFVEKFGNMMKYFGTMALSCPCGSGKTIAGIVLMSILKVPTLIISTRCAINDQWRNTLLKIYRENIVVKTNEGIFSFKESIGKFIKIKKTANITPDVYIYSPQYLTRKDIAKKFPLDVGLIIYDEIHSQLSEEFGKCLLQPFINVMDKKIMEIPCMLGLSATYPATGEFYDIITNIFGTVLTNKSIITNTPIYFYDLRDEYHNTKEGAKDILDNGYKPLDDYEFLAEVLNNQITFYNNYIEPTINGNYLLKLENNSVKTSTENIIEPITTPLCGFVITSSIKSSVYAWINFYQKYKNKKCILIRENIDGCYLLTNNIPDDILELGQLVDFDDILKHKDFNNFCQKLKDYNNGDILIGTYHRLKEGISVENAVWCVCSKFLWTQSTRIQLLGRIRRMSRNDFINNYPRYFLTNSSKIPTNKDVIIVWRRYKRGNKPPKLHITYDLETEAALFAMENYIRIDKKHFLKSDKDINEDMDNDNDINDSK